MSKNKNKHHKAKNQENRNVIYFNIDRFVSGIFGQEQKLSLEFISPKRVYLFFVPFVAVVVFVLSFNAEGSIVLHEIENSTSHIRSVVELPDAPIVDVNPDQVRGVYLTMWSASNSKKMENIFALIDKTEINAVVIDVKGSQGELIYEYWLGIGDLIKKMHEKNIYTIARVVVFQDSGYAAAHPEVALKNKSGGLWRDRRGFAWLDPAAKGSHDHIVDIAKKAIDLGFDEIQYDYIRFPTDGVLSSIVYPAWDGQKPRSDVLREFFEYSKKKLKEYNPNVKTSIDIFGYTFLRNDDLGIGQVLGDAINNFDYISPMVYPSHYGPGNFGFDNPADHPYEVIFKTMEEGLESLGEEQAEVARPKIRPWIQVFDMGARYDSAKIKAQTQAIYDSQMHGWLMWDPNNAYKDVMGSVGAEGEGVAEKK